MNISPDRIRPQPTFDFGMTDLEEQFAGQDGARIRIQVAEALAARAEALLRLMDAGLSPEDFQKVKCVYAAIETAYSIIMPPMKRSKNVLQQQRVRRWRV